MSIDQYKDEMAKQHGIKVIRIDCDYLCKRLEYITNSIKSSFLVKLFDLNKVDFNKCDLDSNNSIFKQVLDDLQ